MDFKVTRLVDNFRLRNIHHSAQPQARTKWSNLPELFIRNIDEKQEYDSKEACLH